MYAQWCAQEQMDGMSSAANRLNSLLYLDLPVGVNPNGYDAWREPALFLAGVNVGAPPDTFFPRGQDWGFAPVHPQRMRQQHFRYYLEALRVQMRQAGLLRVDHVMGLHRLYCIPEGFPASDGAYARYPAEELYALLCLESHRHKTMLAGENLGTVTPEVNQAMAAHSMNSTYVLQYEQQPNTRSPLRAPPRRNVASVNTHDMPPFAAHWQGLDISQRIRLGLLRKTNLSIEQKRRRLANGALAKFLRAQHFLRKGDRVSSRTVLTDCLRFIAASDAQFVLINLEDLWSETNPQNIPGTGLEQRNCMRKARLSLEQLLDCADCESLLREIDRIRRRVER
jgi:4-alpha-glucanotransferase